MFFKKEKPERISLWDLYQMAKVSGVDVDNTPEYKVNTSIHDIIDNDTPVIEPGWYFSIKDNNGNKFEYYVDQKKCESCNEMKRNNIFSKKYKICTPCLKDIKKTWKRRNGYSLNDYIDSVIILNKLSQ